MVPPALEAFGLWVEQLIAESTGKQGKGVIPIAGEAVGPAEQYGDDRLFVRLSVRGAPTEVAARSTDDVRTTYVDQALLGPAVEIELPEATALGAEFMRWEIATAIVGAMLQINPFDEPNVQQAKDATRVLLDAYQTKGQLPVAAADLTLPTGARLVLSQAARTRLGSGNADAIITLIEEGDYFALLAYIGPDDALARELRTSDRRSGIGPGRRRCPVTDRGICIRRDSCTKAVPTRACSCSSPPRPTRISPIPGESFRSAHSSSLRRSAISPRSMRPTGAHCTSTCPGRIRRWCARSPMHCWRVCRSGPRDGSVVCDSAASSSDVGVRPSKADLVTVPPEGGHHVDVGPIA